MQVRCAFVLRPGRQHAYGSGGQEDERHRCDQRCQSWHTNSSRLGRSPSGEVDLRMQQRGLLLLYGD